MSGEPSINRHTDDYYVIDKPAGYAVEPVAAYPSVGDWLISQGKINPKDWPPDGRLGVVHRLDVDTSGVLIWARNPAAQEGLKRLWQGRAVEKTYLGLAVGELPEQGTVELAIRRDNKKDRQKVCLLMEAGCRPAITEYRRLRTAEVAGTTVSLFEAKPITGRTHQIRVHLQHLGHPIVGDKLYGSKSSRAVAKALNLDRHFLHAKELKMTWPRQGKEEDLIFTSPLPDQLTGILDKLALDY